MMRRPIIFLLLMLFFVLPTNQSLGSQNPGQRDNSITPTDLLRYLKEPKSKPTKALERLSERLEKQGCSLAACREADNCQPKLIQFKEHPDYAIVLSQVVWDATSIVLKKQSETDWEVIGFLKSFAKINEPKSRIFTRANEPWLIFDEDTVEGSGLYTRKQGWYRLNITDKGKELKAALSFPIEGNKASTTDQPAIDFKAKVNINNSDQSSFEIVLSYQTKVDSCEVPLFTLNQQAHYKYDSQQPGVFVLDKTNSDISSDLITFLLESEDIGWDQILDNYYEPLKVVASTGQPKAKRCLRNGLKTVKNSKYKKELQKVLASEAKGSESNNQ